MKKIFTLFIIVTIWGCSTQRNTTEFKPVSNNSFLTSPFGFNETVEEFKSNTGLKFKILTEPQENKHYPGQTDTIYTLKYKKSELSFYKSHTGKEFLLAGRIVNKQIKLKNNIHIGINKDEFKSRFSETITIKNNKAELVGEGTKYTFIFENDKLLKIDIDNYFD